MPLIVKYFIKNITKINIEKNYYYLFYLLPDSVPFSKSMQAYTFYLQEKSLVGKNLSLAF